MPWSSRGSPDEVVQPKEASVDGNLQNLNKAVRADNIGSTKSPGMTQSRGDTNQAQRNPKKLQRSPSRQQMNPCSFPGSSVHYMYPEYHQGPPLQYAGHQPSYMGNAPVHYQPAYSPPPGASGYLNPAQQYPPQQQYPSAQQYPPPTLGPLEPPTPIMESLSRRPKYPMPVPLMPTVFQISQGQIMPPWTPSQPAVNSFDTRTGLAVPVYELPPPDLMDYNMSYMIAFRMLPEWTKYKEDTHWEQVRRMRNNYLREQWEGERETCTVM
ncbi:MAG: hypothetical protein Q9186_002314 [Xanthomendoza sp. 1 TL-2023]